MMDLPLPGIPHLSIYDAAMDRFVDKALKKRLSDGRATVMALGDNYITQGTAGNLHSLTQDPSVPPWIHAGDMQKLYSTGLLRKSSDARKYYDKLRLSSPYRVCPFCLHRPVRTLDHYLPKAEYGAYAVLPENLVPCCRDCNSEKDVFVGKDRASTILHPYFDHIDINFWLGCEIIKSVGYCTASFYIISDAVTEDLRPRLLSHMDALDLFELYDVEGARELNEMSGALKSTFDDAGPDGVRSLCETMAASRSALAQNYWRAVLWRAAAGDEQFRSLEWHQAV